MLKPSRPAERAGERLNKEPVGTSGRRNQALVASALPSMVASGARGTDGPPPLMNKIQRIRYGLGDRRPVHFKIAPRVHFAGLGHHHESSALPIENWLLPCALRGVRRG